MILMFVFRPKLAHIAEEFAVVAGFGFVPWYSIVAFPALLAGIRLGT